MNDVSTNGASRSTVLAPVKQESAPLRRKIVAALRRAIDAGALKPGVRLVEKDLCRELNVSRTSLREAIRELEAEGLLDTIPSGGVTVAQITLEQAENIYRVRGALEALAAEQFAENASEEAQIRLQEAVDKIERAYQSGEIAAMLAAKKQFYETLCAGARNNVILDMLNQLNSRINQLRRRSLSRPNRLSASISEMRELVSALSVRDPITARAAALRHVANAGSAALSQPHQGAIPEDGDTTAAAGGKAGSAASAGAGGGHLKNQIR